MFGRDLCHTFSNPNSQITTANAGLLEKVWTFPTGDAVHTSPTVVGDTVYFGSWDGSFYALDKATGTQKWKFDVDCQNAVVPVPPRCEQPPNSLDPISRLANRAPVVGPDNGLIGSTATVLDGLACPRTGKASTRVVLFGGGRTFYSLDAATGEPCWGSGNVNGTVVCGKPDPDDYPNCLTDAYDSTRIRPSPVVLPKLDDTTGKVIGGTIFVGHTANGANGYRGGFVALNANTGNQLARFEVEDARDEFTDQLLNRGCGGVWSSAALDVVNKLVVFGTADCEFDAYPPYHQAIIALHADAVEGQHKLLDLAWYYRPRVSDTCDMDFGASPNVIDLDRDGNGQLERYIGEGGKDGTYYLLSASPTVGPEKIYPEGQLAWKKNVVYGGLAGGFVSSAAFAEGRLYAGTAFGELGGAPCHPENPRDQMLQEPTLHAFDAQSGSVVWQQILSQAFQAPSVAKGVLFLGTYMLPTLRAFDTKTGLPLGVIPMLSPFHSEPALVGDMLFVGSGVSYNSLNSGVHAYRIRSTPVSILGK